MAWSLVLLSFNISAEPARLIYRFWSETLHTHFYTLNNEEVLRLETASPLTWQLERAAWSGLDRPVDPASVPVYRLQRLEPRAHFYTTDWDQYHSLVANDPEQWLAEGIAWYAYTEPYPGTVPIYQFFRCETARCMARRDHNFVTYDDADEVFYTSDEAERDQLIVQAPRFIDAGIAWWSYPVIMSDEALNIGIDTNMTAIAGGCFYPILSDGRQNTDYRVCVDDFFMGRYEVTQRLWQTVMGENPAAEFYACADCPVEMVSWHDVQNFLITLNTMTGRHYRLPTEMEWEYACRAGASSQESLCGSSSMIDDVAWHQFNADGTIHPVGQKAPNDWGLYDLNGNVSEWVCSLYAPTTTGAGQTCADVLDYGYRITRGSSWINSPNVMHAAWRERRLAADRAPYIGLRLVHD
jgi:formylglycine-generating enzyme required for sulfatase activity